MLQRTIFSFIFVFIFLQANASVPSMINPPERVPMEIALPILETINNDAIIIGYGADTIFVFVDPFCPRSQEFIALINSSIEMQAHYTYKIFLFSFSEHFDSAHTVEHIYQTIDPKKTMIHYMTLHVRPMGLLKPSPSVILKINKIAKVGQRLFVYKRPYLFVHKQSKQKNSIKGGENVL